MPNPADTLTLADLKNWNRRDEAGNFLPSLAVLGHPVAHSVSPQMHNAALAELLQKRSLSNKRNQDLKDWRYFKFEIRPEELEEAFELLAKKNFRGVNLTIPHKIQATGLVKTISKEAKQIGAVNTLIPISEGTGGWRGENTDTYGVMMAVKRDLQIEAIPRDVVVLGSGGAARGAALQCLLYWHRDLWICARDAKKRKTFADELRTLLKELKPNDPGFGKKVHEVAELDSRPFRNFPEGVLLINATSLGLEESDPLPLDVCVLPGNSSVLDMIYRRNGTTQLVTEARKHGLSATDGLGMLVWQGEKSLESWIGRKPSAQTMMDAACAALGLPPRHA
jgi:shikimate dehydrogenase